VSVNGPGFYYYQTKRCLDQQILVNDVGGLLVVSSTLLWYDNGACGLHREVTPLRDAVTISSAISRMQTECVVPLLLTYHFNSSFSYQVFCTSYIKQPTKDVELCGVEIFCV